MTCCHCEVLWWHCAVKEAKIFFYQHHLSFSNEPNPKLNLRTVINNNKISLWLQPEIYPCKRTNTVQNRREYPCRVAMNQATVTLVFSPIRLNHATMPPPPILSSIPLAFTHMHVPKPHTYQMQSVQAKPLAAARSYRFTSHTHGSQWLPSAASVPSLYPLHTRGRYKSPGHAAN